MKADVREEHATLIRYFLGELPERERETVEERYMLDDEYAGLREEAELDLVDAYASGTLSEEARRHFEQRYLITRERKEAVQAAYLSVLYRQDQARAKTKSVSPAQGRYLTPFRVLWAMAAGLVFVIAGSAWFFTMHPRSAKLSATVVKSHAPASAKPFSNSSPGTAPSTEEKNASALVAPRKNKPVLLRPSEPPFVAASRPRPNPSHLSSPYGPAKTAHAIASPFPAEPLNPPELVPSPLLPLLPPFVPALNVAPVIADDTTSPLLRIPHNAPEPVPSAMPSPRLLDETKPVIAATNAGGGHAFPHANKPASIPKPPKKHIKPPTPPKIITAHPK